VDIESLRGTYLNECVTRNCLCGSSSNILVKVGDRYGLPIKYSLCLHCGHVFTKNPLPDQQIIEFYSSSAYRTMYSNGATPEEIIKKKTPARFGQNHLLRLTKNVLNVFEGNVLEWGCGGGWNLVPFRDAGYQTMGVDFDGAYIRAGSRLNGLNLKQIDDETTLQLSTINFDVIILNHVLEHSVDPFQLLIDLRKLCGSKTYLIIGLPTLESMKIWGFLDYFHIAHLDYFCKSSFVRLAGKAGFSLFYEEASQGLFVLVPSTIREIKLSRKNVLSSMFMIFKSWQIYFVKLWIRKFGKITKTEKLMRSVVRMLHK